MMAEIGKINALEIVKQVDFGLYLDGGEEGEILLPKRYIPDDWEMNDIIDVFIYLDSEDRIIATTELPFAEVGDCATLRATNTTKFGTFMNWGLMKDLFVPFSEQRIPMIAGKEYTVYIYIDNSGRIAGSSKLERYLYAEDDDDFEPGEEVDLLVSGQSDLGYKAVINGTHVGLIHKSAIFQRISQGDRFKGYVQDIRPDGKINLMLRKPGQHERKDLADMILDHLESAGGISTITDKSSPELIKDVFGTSKSHFKRAIGLLYKAKKIKLEPGKIILNDE
ncbi:S1-like domain-containing RNA-binding protein [Temperatibacter marinus]|uniref:S1-like domain-containing RNA-binding protein n=1 Tax=Temperatibacter marinus TaxID=1456591 RepID=A0AA52EK77_9PROT|nr:S1-like domain-containing RNA-binding protein [Temperatibacter marinus]WND04047.1 S1-like domain-containing RNA-binding protein [Temperatibacter marinus]